MTVEEQKKLLESMVTMILYHQEKVELRDIVQQITHLRNRIGDDYFYDLGMKETCEIASDLKDKLIR